MNSPPESPLNLSSHFAEHCRDAVEALRTVEGQLPQIERAATLIVESLQAGGKILTCGNGGSAAQAQHLSEELVGRYLLPRRSLPSVCLVADGTLLTCIVNDYGADEVFARQVDGLGQPQDVLIGFSTSGNSENIRRALERAERNGVHTISLLGRDGGVCRGMATVEVVIPGVVTARIQEAHLLILHLLCEAVDITIPPLNSTVQLPLPMTPEKPSSTEFMLPEGLRLWSLPDGGVVLKRGSERHVVGTIKRALPLSEPERFIVLYDDDGHEIGTVQDISELEPDSQTVLRAALYRAYHIERITRVLEVEREPLSGQTRWRVELADEEGEPAASNDEEGKGTGEIVETSQSRTRTSITKPVIKRLLRRNTDESEDPEVPADRVKTREREFLIAGQEDVSTARYPHIFIVDTERNRYEILNCEQLDADSRRLAERYF